MTLCPLSESSRLFQLHRCDLFLFFLLFGFFFSFLTLEQQFYILDKDTSNHTVIIQDSQPSYQAAKISKRDVSVRLILSSLKLPWIIMGHQHIKPSTPHIYCIIHNVYVQCHSSQKAWSDRTRGNSFTDRRQG